MIREILHGWFSALAQPTWCCHREGWAMIALAKYFPKFAWMIWKEGNARIFSKIDCLPTAVSNNLLMNSMCGLV